MKIKIQGHEFQYGRHYRDLYGWWAKPVGGSDLWSESTHGFTKYHALALAYNRWVLKRKVTEYSSSFFTKPTSVEAIKELLRRA